MGVASEGEYLGLLKPTRRLVWSQSRDDPPGVEEVVLHRHKDGSYSHLLRIKAGVELTQPAVHDFYEEVYYISGEMLNTKTGKKIRGGDYVFHSPGEPHGPFKCLKSCLLFEVRYYK